MEDRQKFQRAENRQNFKQERQREGQNRKIFKEHKKHTASGTTNPAGDTTLASGIIDADVGTTSDANPVLQALEPIDQSLSCPM